MKYRLFEPDDFRTLYSIEEVCFSTPERFSRSYMLELVRSSSTAVWIAEAEGVMAGFAIVELAEQAAGIVAYVATIEVLPAFRRAGIGRGLLERLEASAIAKHATEIWLHVDLRNQGAVSFYQQQGYAIRGQADHYYARNRHAGVYQKSLN